jgi:signal peptidase II
MLRLGLAIAALGLGLDQITKWWIRVVVMDPPVDIEVTPFFKLVLAWNRGISFSLFRSDSPTGPWIFVAIALAVVAGLVVWLARLNRAWPGVALGLVIGGALGNVADRIRFHAVVDFLYFHLGEYYFPAFNVADSAISVGVVLLVLDGLFVRPGGKR